MHQGDTIFFKPILPITPSIQQTPLVNEQASSSKNKITVNPSPYTNSKQIINDIENQRSSLTNWNTDKEFGKKRADITRGI